jgi:hypothetical protein
MRDLDKELQQNLQRSYHDINYELLSAAQAGDLEMVKHIVGKGVDLSYKHECIHTLVRKKKKVFKCVAAIVKTKLDEKIKKYHDDDYFKDDALDLWDGDGTRNRNQLYKEIDLLEEVYDYLRIETRKDHPHLVL